MTLGGKTDGVFVRELVTEGAGHERRVVDPVDIRESRVLPTGGAERGDELSVAIVGERGLWRRRKGEAAATKQAQRRQRPTSDAPLKESVALVLNHGGFVAKESMRASADYLTT
jgi:hypothetical protein